MLLPSGRSIGTTISAALGNRAAALGQRDRRHLGFAGEREGAHQFGVAPGKGRPDETSPGRAAAAIISCML
jgi:hypothetical protein